MEKYLFMKKVIDAISDGRFFKKAVAMFLRILALVIIIWSIMSWVGVWKAIVADSAKTIIGMAIFQILFIVALYMVVHAMLIRANDIEGLSDETYTMISITSVFFKLCGEVYAAFGVIVSLAGGILIWFIGRNAYYFIGKVSLFKYGYGFGYDFLGGLTFIVGGWLVAFFVLIFFYFLSEAVIVIADIAKNTKKSR